MKIPVGLWVKVDGGRSRGWSMDSQGSGELVGVHVEFEN